MNNTTNNDCSSCIYMQNLKENIKEHKEILDKHEDDITELKADGREYKTEIKNLCKQVSNLVTTMKWFIGIWLTSLMGFFFYMIEKGLIK